MTKKEIQELTEIVMNAEAKEVNTGYSSTSGIEFIYKDGNFTATFFVHLHDECSARKVFLEVLIKKARKSEPRKNIPKKELELFPTQTQEHLLWWKSNLDKTGKVLRLHKEWSNFDDKWRDVRYVDMTADQETERKLEYKRLKSEKETLGIERLNVHLLAFERSCIPLSWTKA